MSEVFNYCQIVGRTDVGRKRPANEDSMGQATTQNGLVAVVCDGMGGHVGGATASKIAVSTIIEQLNTVYYEDPRIAIGEAIETANHAILRTAQEQPELRGMGSTCVLLLVRNGKVYIGHVGDSRIYLIRSRRIRQLTKDHSYVQMLVDCGEITREQMEHHPRKNEITNALGLENMKPATVCGDAILPEAGDCFLLCSDGLSGMVPDHVICKVISKQAEMNAQERVDRLIKLANENGGVDNITGELVEFSITPGAESEVAGSKKKRGFWIVMAAVLAAVLLVVLGCWWYSADEEEPQKVTEPVPEQQVEVKKEVKKEPIQEKSFHLGTVRYKKNAQLVQLVFSKDLCEVKFQEKTCFERFQFNPQSLKFDYTILRSSFKPISGYENCVSTLYFTDQKPGDKVEFSIMTSDSAYLYKYTLDVKGGGTAEAGRAVPPAPKAKSNSAVKHEQTPHQDDVLVKGIKRDAKVLKPDTLCIEFVFEKLSMSSRLVLNYQDKAHVVFNDLSGKKYLINKSLGLSIAEVYTNEINVSDKLFWNIDASHKGSLILNGSDAKSNDSYWFTIPCKLKDSKVLVVRIELKQKLVQHSDVKSLQTHSTDGAVQPVDAK